MQPDRWTVVITGGAAIPAAAVGTMRTLGTSAVIAADGGLDHAVAAGVEPTHLVGDLDSLSAAGRMWAYAHGLAIDEHPADKDRTDTELALKLPRQSARAASSSSAASASASTTCSASCWLSAARQQHTSTPCAP